MKRNVIISGVLIVAFMLSGCYVDTPIGKFTYEAPAIDEATDNGMNPEETETEDVEMTETEETKEIENTEEQLDSVFTENTYEKAAYFLDTVNKDNPAENAIVSPLSLDMALGLISGGAKGQTKDEINAYLGKDDYGKFASEYMQYAENLNQDFSDMKIGGYKTRFEIANSVWISDEEELISDYAKSAERDFKAAIESVSFKTDNASKTAKTINKWCKNKTHNLIPSIVEETDISEDLVAILINSLYFEAPWQENFMVMNEQSEFTNVNGEKTKQYMLDGNTSVYYENEYATGFAKAYQNGLTFVGILPKNEGDFNVMDLDLQSFMESENSDNIDVHVIMPKLNFETATDKIIPILEAQGMKQPFDKVNADFSGLVKVRDDRNVYISDILQKCKIELDENGTKAAAVTAIMAKEMAMPIVKEFKQVYLDRPFAFMIYDSENEQIVFIGKVVKP